MRSPWVSRELYDAGKRERDELVDDLSAERALGEQRYNNLLRRYDELLEKFTALRVQGAVPEPKGSFTMAEMERAYPEPVERDELKALIHARCGPDYRKRGMMLAQLATDRAEGVDDDAIRSMILNGQSIEGVPA